jgi:H+/Cl- antiporter ClcA
VAALCGLIAFKGLAWSISLASFGGGPIFRAMLLGSAAGILASHLPGIALTPAVAVGLGAAVVAMARLPLTAVLLAVILTGSSGVGSSPLIVVGVVAAFLTVHLLDREDPAHWPTGP